ncbi:MAG: polysaccharide biosynthesis tyrosine autokinase [Deltaproteobacteria bacterium]|nr:polysaccharide biosynthesis tyrosine autokinase [Deltaproteobacteria bacterium]
MNLRKALDKARQMRGESLPRPLTSGKPVVIARSPDRQWKPPEYSQSRSMHVQPAQLMENRCVCIEPDAAELEAYKVLRTRIQMATKTKGWNTIMITSPNAGDGKTLTAINLALTFAKAYNQTVMLVDCDLRRQNIHRVLGIESGAGIVDFLVDDKPLNEFIIWPGIEKLSLISGGRSIQNSAEVIGSARMKSLIQELKTRYDDRFIIIDAPPILSGADTMALAPCVDCILMVVKESRTRMHEIKKAMDMIPKDKFLGYVMNHQRKAGKAYYY